MTERPLRILQVSPTDVRGGAERVAWNLFMAYRARGHCSWLAVGEKQSRDPNVLLIPNDAAHGQWYRFWRAISRRLQRSEVATPLSRLSGGLAQARRRLDYYRGIEDFHFPGTARLLELAPQRPDILHGHNLHGEYFDLRLLSALSQQVPVLLTLHDAWLLSGHCAHSLNCERWQTGCGRCPDLTLYPAIQRDATAYNWRRKQEIFINSRLYVTTPSRWLMKKVEQSMLAPAVVQAQVVPNGVDLGIFHPAERSIVRTALGISPETKVLLITGVKLQRNVWKDYHTLREAFLLVASRQPDRELLLLALGEEAPPERTGQAEIRFIPYQEDQLSVARYYQAADIYVHTARADTFPTSILEALACGTPVVATAVGGIPEQIEDSETGFLVPAGDAHVLAARITQLLSDDRLRQEMGIRAAWRAQRHFGLDRQVDTYLSWYAQLTKTDSFTL